MATRPASDRPDRGAVAPAPTDSTGPTGPTGPTPPAVERPAASAPERALRGAARPYWRWLIGRILRVKLAAVALAVIVLFCALALLAPLLGLADPTRAELLRALQAPSFGHPLGTDDLGRDVLSRIVFGTRVSLAAGLVSAAIGLIAGGLLGLVAGYFGGRVDAAIMRVMDALLAFPGLVLALAITAALGPSLVNAVIAIGVVSIPRFSRLARAQVLSVKVADYVEAARAIGAGHRRILYRYIAPNILTPIIVQTSLSIAFAVLTEASLSFLGLGVQPPTPSWGFMLNQGRAYVELAPWLALFPGLAILLLVLAFNLLGDAIRDALDPRLRL